LFIFVLETNHWCIWLWSDIRHGSFAWWWEGPKLCQWC